MPKDKDKHSSIKEKQPSASRSKRRSDDEECSQQQEVVAEVHDSALVPKLKTSRRSDPASHRDEQQSLSIQSGSTTQSSRKGNARVVPSEEMDTISDAPAKNITNQEQALKVIKDLSPEILRQFLNSFGAFCNLSEKYINQLRIQPA